MPGFEIVGKEELTEIEHIFAEANGVQFRLGFDHLRNGIFKVAEFERAFASRMRVKNSQA
jgi:8-amino-3,8-dideoxy-alpha-D-manno-octulosonate transaminase